MLNHEAIARQAIIKLNPVFYSLTKQQQSEWMHNISDDIQNKFETIVVEKMGLDPSTDVSKHPQHLNDFNHIAQYLRGIGNCYFSFNEFDSQEALKHPDVFSYNEHYWNFQNEANAEEFPEFQPYPPQVMLQHWIRMIVEKKFYYCTMHGAHMAVVYDLEELGREMLDELIPHEYYHGDNHGKKSEHGFGNIFDIQIDAGGFERHLEQLRFAVHEKIYGERRDACVDYFEKQNPGFCLIESVDSEEGLNLDIIPINRESLKGIRFETFYDDVKAKWSPACEALVNDKIHQERKDFENWLLDKHQDVMENFDPNVVPFRKKFQIVDATEGGIFTEE